jgi:hypothetical protein
MRMELARPGADSAADRAEWGWRIAAVAVVVVTLAAWARVPSGTFQYDDHDSVVTSPAPPTPASWARAWRSGFRPLLTTSYLLDRRLLGPGPSGFLVTNLLIHLGCALLVLALARRRSLPAVGAAAAALAFALQPADAEAVAYVSGRSSSLAALLLLAGLLAHDRAASAETPGTRRAGSLLAFALFAAAVAVKETALVLPLLVAVWEGTRPAPRRVRARPLVVLHAAGGLGLAVLVLASPRLRELLRYSFEVSPPLRSLAANLAAAPSLVSLWGRPRALSIEHPLPEVTPGAVALGATLAALVVVGGLLLARRRPHAALALLWVPVALLPTNSLVWKLDPVSERSLYLAWVGPALALGAAAGALARLARRPAFVRFAAAATAVTVIAGAGDLVRQRVAVWSDSRSLWREAADRAPASARAWNNLGMAHWEHDEPVPARAAFRRVLELAPGDARARQNLFALALADSSSADVSPGGAP